MLCVTTASVATFHFGLEVVVEWMRLGHAVWHVRLVWRFSFGISWACGVDMHARRALFCIVFGRRPYDALCILWQWKHLIGDKFQSLNCVSIGPPSATLGLYTAVV